MNDAKKTPHKDIVRGLREHYEDLSRQASHWSSGMEKAIDAYEREPELLAEVRCLQAENARLRTQVERGEAIANSLELSLRELSPDEIEYGMSLEEIADAILANALAAAEPADEGEDDDLPLVPMPLSKRKVKMRYTQKDADTVTLPRSEVRRLVDALSLYDRGLGYGMLTARQALAACPTAVAACSGEHLANQTQEE